MVQESNRQIEEKTVQLEEALEASSERSESLERSRSPHDALGAIDHSQWELDKMKRDMQQLVRDENLRSEFVASMCKQHVGIPRGTKENSGVLGTRLGGVSHESSVTHLEVRPDHVSKSEASHVPEVEKSLKLPPCQHSMVTTARM